VLNTRLPELIVKIATICGAAVGVIVFVILSCPIWITGIVICLCEDVCNKGGQKMPREKDCEECRQGIMELNMSYSPPVWQCSNNFCKAEVEYDEDKDGKLYQ